MNIKLILAIVGFNLLTSCSDNPKPNFDFKNWASDTKGCKGIRSKLSHQFSEIQSFLTKKSEKEVIKYLGRPDAIELNKRHIKTYIYQLEPSLSCDSNYNLDTNSTLVYCIEFNSLGLSSIISEQLR